MGANFCCGVRSSHEHMRARARLPALPLCLQKFEKEATIAFVLVWDGRQLIGGSQCTAGSLLVSIWTKLFCLCGMPHRQYRHYWLLHSSSCFRIEWRAVRVKQVATRARLSRRSLHGFAELLPNTCVPTSVQSGAVRDPTCGSDRLPAVALSHPIQCGREFFGENQYCSPPHRSMTLGEFRRGRRLYAQRRLREFAAEPCL